MQIAAALDGGIGFLMSANLETRAFNISVNVPVICGTSRHIKPSLAFLVCSDKDGEIGVLLIWTSILKGLSYKHVIWHSEMEREMEYLVKAHCSHYATTHRASISFFIMDNRRAPHRGDFLSLGGIFASLIKFGPNTNLRDSLSIKFLKQMSSCAIIQLLCTVLCLLLYHCSVKKWRK